MGIQDTNEQLTPQDIELVKSSWNLIYDDRIEFAKNFYMKLFEVAPAVQPLFKADLETQAYRLTEKLNLLIQSLDDLDDMISGIKSMGLKHKTYGVKPKHYLIVTKTFIRNLENFLADSYSKDIGTAWLHFQNFLSKYMILGAKRR